jgi:hypothetical protein
LYAMTHVIPLSPAEQVCIGAPQTVTASVIPALLIFPAPWNNLIDAFALSPGAHPYGRIRISPPTLG